MITHINTRIKDKFKFTLPKFHATKEEWARNDKLRDILLQIEPESEREKKYNQINENEYKPRYYNNATDWLNAIEPIIMAENKAPENLPQYLNDNEFDNDLSEPESEPKYKKGQYIQIRVNKNIYEDFNRTCEDGFENPRLLIEAFMRKYINEPNKAEIKKCIKK